MLPGRGVLPQRRVDRRLLRLAAPSRPRALWCFLRGFVFARLLRPPPWLQARALRRESGAPVGAGGMADALAAEAPSASRRLRALEQLHLFCKNSSSSSSNAAHCSWSKEDDDFIRISSSNERTTRFSAIPSSLGFSNTRSSSNGITVDNNARNRNIVNLIFVLLTIALLFILR